MSRTLNLIDSLLNSGRHLCEIGRTAEAIEVLTRLADFRQLPADVIEQIQALLAKLYLDQENYSKARRHLTAALAFRPLKAEYHHLMGVAIEEDDQADLKRAEMYYAEAVKQEADNAGYRIDYGTYLLRIGKRTLGLKAVRKAYVLGIQEADIVGQVAEALRSEDCFEEAGTKLLAALFHNRSAEPFQRLWQQHQFQRLHEQQSEKNCAATGRKKGAVILPFTPGTQTGTYVDLGEKTLRIDPAERPRGPKSPMPMQYRKPPKG